MPPSPIVPLDRERTLSESILWPLIERFYGEGGPVAFDQTPYYPTNNAYLAEAYAELIIAFFQDQVDDLDPAEPVYIIECAGGLGVLAYLILQALSEAWDRQAALRPFRWTYVLTDFTERTLQLWREDPQLVPFAERGQLDFALWRPETEDEISLRVSGRQLSAATLRHPPVVIANYFFDSIRCDFFRTERGDLREVRVEVLGPAGRTSQDVPLSEVQLRDRNVPLRTGVAYYPEARIDAVLRELARVTEADQSFLFPIGGLRVLERVETLSRGRYALLVADKAFYELDYTRGEQTLPYTPHTGSFSFAVNYRALAHYLRHSRGQVFIGPENPTLTCLVASTVAGTDGGAFALLARRLVEKLAWPQTGYATACLARAFQPGADVSPAEQRHALLQLNRLAAHDPWVFSCTGEALCHLYPTDEYGARRELLQTLSLVGARLHRRSVGASEGGRYLRRLYLLSGETEACLRWNKVLHAWFGDDRDVHFYPAAVAEKRGEWTLAIQGYERALARDPACAITKAALARVREARGDRHTF